MDIEIGVMQQKVLECTKNLIVMKIISISYPLLKQSVMSMKALMKHGRIIRFFSRQGLAFWRNNNEENFEQLMKLNANVDPRITSWMGKMRPKYLHNHAQNEVIRLMAFIILRDIAKKYQR